MAKQALGPNQEKWLAALESGKFKQTKDGYLRTIEGRYCCLGVACELFGPKATGLSGNAVRFGKESTSNAPKKTQYALALRGCLGQITDGTYLSTESRLADANDRGVSFKRIAAFCRKHPEAVFTEPR